MLLINAVNTEGRPLEIYIRDGKIAAVGQDLSALAGEGDSERGVAVFSVWCGIYHRTKDGKRLGTCEESRAGRY